MITAVALLILFGGLYVQMVLVMSLLEDILRALTKNANDEDEAMVNREAEQ